LLVLESRGGSGEGRKMDDERRGRREKKDGFNGTLGDGRRSMGVS
jgi:hypothetical protein